MTEQHTSGEDNRTYNIIRCYEDSEIYVAIGIQSLREVEEIRRRLMKEAAFDTKFTSQPDFYIEEVRRAG